MGADPSGEERQQLRVDLPQALDMAVQFHRQGWLEPAEEFYRAVLKLEPGEPNALHYLGVLLHQTGKSEAGVELLRAYHRASELAPENPSVLNNLGVVLKALDRPEEAEVVLRKAIVIAPKHAEAWFNLGFMHKDIELALDAARRLGIPLPTAERADEVLERAQALGYERHDLAALFQALERMADGDRPGTAHP